MSSLTIDQKEEETWHELPTRTQRQRRVHRYTDKDRDEDIENCMYIEKYLLSIILMTLSIMTMTMTKTKIITKTETIANTMIET